MTRLQNDLLAPLDSFRNEQPDKPGRPEAIRQILREWLAKHGYMNDD